MAALMKRLLLIFLLLAPRVLFASFVAKNDGGTPSITFTATNSVDQTAFVVNQGPNRCLVSILFSVTGDLSAGATLTWDSTGTIPQTMTSVLSVGGASNLRIQVFKLIAPHTGNLNLHASWTNNATGRLVSMAWSGTDQSTPCDVTADRQTASETTATTRTVTVTSNTSGVTIAAIAIGAGFNITSDNQTSLLLANSPFGQGVTYALAGTSNAHTWNFDGSVNNIGVGIHITNAATTGYFGLNTFDSTTIRQMAAGAASCDGQSNWQSFGITTDYNQVNNDAREGAWFTNTSNALTTCTLTAPTNFVSGTLYYIFFYAHGYDNCSNLSITVGAVTSTVVPAEDRNPSLCSSGNHDNGDWTIAATITPAITTSSYTFNVAKVGTDNKLLFRGIFITTDSSLTVIRTGSIGGEAVSLTLPSGASCTPTGGNYIAGGDFEAGLDPGQWGVTASVTPTQPSTLWSTSAAFSGMYGVSIPTEGYSGFTEIFRSRTYHLKSNCKYTVSARARVQTGTLSCSIGMVNPFIPPSGFTGQYSFSKLYTLTTSFQSITINQDGTNFALAYPSSDYYVSFKCSPSASNHLYIDEVSVLEGTSTTYAAANPLEYTISTGVSGNIYFPTDTLTATVRAYNSTAALINKSLHYEVRDPLLRAVIPETTVSLSVAAGSVGTATFSINPGKVGWFWLRTWFDGENNTDREYEYAIVTDFNGPSLDTTSSFGTHCTNQPYQLTELRRLGFKWCRTLSPGHQGEWFYAEPTEGNFVYFDSDFTAMATAGITPYMVLNGTNPTYPSYADDGTGKPDLTKWSTYVGTLVNHYKATVKYWGIWNEESFSPDFYAQLAKTAADAIEGNDLNDTTIVAMSGVNTNTITSVISALDARYCPSYPTTPCSGGSPNWNWRDHFSVLDIHAYPGGFPPESATTLVDTYKPTWNTESGYFDFGAYVANNTQWTAPGISIYPYGDAARFYDGLGTGPSAMTQLFARTLSSKLTNDFHYDSRNITIDNRDFQGPHSTSMMEFDDTLGVKAVTASIGAFFLDHATRQGDKSPSGTSRFLLFDKSGANPVAFIQSNDYLPRSVTLSGTAADYQLFDYFGNSLSFTGTTIPYGRYPVYLKCINGVSTSTCGSRLTAGTIATRADTTAPTVIIADAPRSPTFGLPSRFRWIGMDDVALPNLGDINTDLTIGESSTPEGPNPDAILYSYKVVGEDSAFSDWSEITYIDRVLTSSATAISVRAKDTAGNISATTTLNWVPIPPSAGAKHLKVRVH